jgi:hypothetical protein
MQGTRDGNSCPANSRVPRGKVQDQWQTGRLASGWTGVSVALDPIPMPDTLGPSASRLGTQAMALSMIQQDLRLMSELKLFV